MIRPHADTVEYTPTGPVDCNRSSAPWIALRFGARLPDDQLLAVSTSSHHMDGVTPTWLNEYSASLQPMAQA